MSLPPVSLPSSDKPLRSAAELDKKVNQRKAVLFSNTFLDDKDEVWGRVQPHLCTRRKRIRFRFVLRGGLRISLRLRNQGESRAKVRGAEVKRRAVEQAVPEDHDRSVGGFARCSASW